MKPVTSRTKTASPGEVIIAEGFVGLPAMYVIKEGQVELSVMHEDVKVVLSTLGKGQFFGESILVSSEPRSFTARALTFCELQVVEASAVKGALDGVPAFLRHMLNSLIQSSMKKDELLAAHENIQTQPDILSYAHIVALMGAADAGTRGTRREREASVILPVAEVVKKCREVTGHSRRHVVLTLKRMSMLNLVFLDGARDGATDSVLAGAQNLRFSPTDIVPRAQKLAQHNLDGGPHGQLEIIELEGLEVLTGVDRKLLLKKLAHGEIAEDLFNFRRTEVLRYIAEKGKEYFSKRQNRGQIDSIDDLMSVDKRILFEALAGMDEFDLAKLFEHVGDQDVRVKLYACMTKLKREEIEKLVEEGTGTDAEEAQAIEDMLLDTVRALRRPAGTPAVAGQDNAAA